MSEASSGGDHTIDDGDMTGPNVENAGRCVVDGSGTRAVFRMESHHETSDVEVLAGEERELGTRQSGRWTRTVALRPDEGASSELLEDEHSEERPSPPWRPATGSKRPSRERSEGKQIMTIATREMGFAREVANTVCFLGSGQILKIGPPEQYFEAPRVVRTRSVPEAGKV